MHLWRYKKEGKRGRKRKEKEKEREKGKERRKERNEKSFALLQDFDRKRFHFQWARPWTNFHVWIFLQKRYYSQHAYSTPFDCHYFIIESAHLMHQQRKYSIFVFLADQ
jgi:hypothetical protein